MARPRGPRGELPARPRAHVRRGRGGATRARLPGVSWAFLVSPSPGYVRVRLPAAQQPLSQLFSSGGAGGRLLLGGLRRGPIGPRMRARERARSPPPGLLSAGKPQGDLSCQTAPPLLEHSSRSRLADCSKLASPSTASIWGHLNRRRRPQARSRSEPHEILTATAMLRRGLQDPAIRCLPPSAERRKRPSRLSAPEVEVGGARQVTRAMAQ